MENVTVSNNLVSFEIGGDSFRCEPLRAKQLIEEFGWTSGGAKVIETRYPPSYIYHSHNSDGIFAERDPNSEEYFLQPIMFIPSAHHSHIPWVIVNDMVKREDRPPTAFEVDRYQYHSFIFVDLDSEIPFWVSLDGADLVLWVGSEADYLKWKMLQ